MSTTNKGQQVLQELAAYALKHNLRVDDDAFNRICNECDIAEDKAVDVVTMSTEVIMFHRRGNSWVLTTTKYYHE